MSHDPPLYTCLKISCNKSFCIKLSLTKKYVVLQELKPKRLNIIPYIDQDDTSEQVSCMLYLFHPREKLEQLMSEKLL